MSADLIRHVTVVAYILSAILCAVNIPRAGKATRGTWIGIVLVLIFLGMSKQWNLLPGWMAALREAAWLQGWYSLRQIFQVIFIIVIVLFLLAWFIAILRNSPWQLWGSLTATTLLLALSMVRAVSFHMIDLFLYQELVPGVQPNWLLEWGGILMAGASAVLAYFFPRIPIQTTHV